MVDRPRLYHFSSFMPALSQNPERGLKTTRLCWLMNGRRLRFSAVTNSHSHCSSSVTGGPLLCFCTVTQTRSTMHISFNASDRRHFWLIWNQTSRTITPVSPAVKMQWWHWPTGGAVTPASGWGNAASKAALKICSTLQFTFNRNI